MLTFQDGVCCQVFRLEVATVLHQASAWAAIVGVPVVVTRMGASPDARPPEPSEDLAVDLATPAGREQYLVPLSGYLARNLSDEYAVSLEGDRVHVEWFGAPHL